MQRILLCIVEVEGSFNVSYTPVNTGKHHIMITIEGNSFSGSLFEIDVSPVPPYATMHRLEMLGDERIW